MEQVVRKADEGKLGDTCPVCGNSEFIDRKLKRYCQTCGNLCETCCDGGDVNAPA